MPRAPSFWIDATGGFPPAREPLAGGIETDVAIVGAGYTGLWTAYHLKRADPGREVVVLEARQAGFGASGRNGGWVLGALAGSRERYARGPAGRAGVIRLLREIRATVTSIGETVAREGIDCDWRTGGTLSVARSTPELERLRALQQYERDWDQEVTWLDGHQARERIAIPGALAALFWRECARVQPAKLAFGLACAAERLGVRIHEHTPVTRIEPGAAHTARGVVRARIVVRATEGYTARLPGLRRALLPLNSSMIITEPLPQQAWEEIGWDGCETLKDGAHVYLYAQRTADGRIALGGRGSPYRFGSRTDVAGEIPRRTVAELTRTLHELLPAAREVPVARAWSGVLGVSRDWAPQVGLTPGLAWAGGYVGEGVAASHLAGRILAEAITGAEPDLVRLPIVGTGARRWEPEPLRYTGVRSLYGAYRAADRRERRTGRPAGLAALADRVTGKPAG